MGLLIADFASVRRTFRAKPVSSGATICVIALGIGLATVMFALADPFLLRPLPYAQPDELAVITLREVPNADWVWAPPPGSIPTLVELQAHDDVFAAVGTYRLGPVLRLRTAAGTVALQTEEIAGPLLDVLGVFGKRQAWRSDGAPLDGVITLTSSGVEKLASKPADIVGAVLQGQDGRAMRVGRVLPPDFIVPRNTALPRVDALIAVRPGALLESSRQGGMGSAPFTVIARLQPSVSCVRVSGVLRASAGAMAGVAIDVQPLRRYMTQRHRILALATVVTAGLILVICATNLANLLLLRIAHRATELRIRAFMGASQWDVDRLIGMEVAILGAAGAACGLLLTRVALTFVRAVIPAEYAALGEPSVTLRAAVFAGCATLLVATAAGATARAAIRIPLRRVLDRPMSAALPARRTIGFSVAAAQAAFTVVLLVAAALLVRSWVNLRTRDTGFAGNVIVASVSYPAGGFQLQSSMDQTLEAIRRLPAVSAAASAMGAMADRSQWNVVVEVGGEMVPVAGKFVTPGYFDATGSRLLAGRGFSEHDQPNVIVVNETFARRYYPQGAVGRILGRHDVAEVVGVVGDALDQALDADPRPTVFWLLAAPQCSGCNNVLSYVVRPAARPPNLRSLIRGTITRVSPDAIVVEVASMDERLTGSIADRWFATLIVVFFAVAAVTICAGGVFATAASLVARRTREIAVRVALGARPSQVLRLVVRDSLTATAMGVAIGTIAGVWVSQTLRTMLYGVQPGDPVTTALGVLAMFGATAASALVPAARALRLSPTEALREE